MVKAVLFDMGGVLVTSPFAGIAAYERQAGLPEGFIRRVNATNPDSNAWACFERGELDYAEFVRRFEAEAAALGHRVDGAAVLDAMRGEPIDEMLVAVERVRDVAHTGLLTNNVRPLDPASPVALRLLPLFDVVVQSSVEGVRKPDPAFYLLACERLGVEPPDCVFLDDLGVNCKPARALGMHTIKVVDTAEALTELERVLGVTLR
ncbi:MAG TPA: HAD-IA family hydrolase [Acidimicrobiales bacterium]